MAALLQSPIDHTLLRTLVHQHAKTIFEDMDAQVEVQGVRVSRPLHYRSPPKNVKKIHNDPYFHHLLTIDYVASDKSGCKKVWLKFGSSLKLSFELHRYAYEGMKQFEGFIPRPYFLYEPASQPYQLIAMEYVRGTSLRYIVLGSLLARRSFALAPTFGNIGRRMRAFHDMSPEQDGEKIGDVVARARECVLTTDLLDESGKSLVDARLATAAGTLNMDCRLPAVYCHNDWAIRNLIRRPNGALAIIDLDSMRSNYKWSAPASRWYEVLYFLINIEKQIKYAPVTSIRQLSLLAQAFLGGYFAPGSCSDFPIAHLQGLLYVMKVDRAFGGGGRRTLFKKFGSRLDRLYLHKLHRSLRDGCASLLSIEQTHAGFVP